MTRQSSEFDAVVAAARTELGEPSRTRVRDYAHPLYARPSIVSAIIEWPNPMPPSQHVADIETAAAS